MNITQYIVNDIKPFDCTKNIKEVQTAFNQLTHSHIPISKEGIYIGCLSETDAYCFESNKKINEYFYALETFFVKENSNWLDILEAFAIHDSNIMPVLNSENKYIGYFELNDILSIFNKTPFLNETGGIIVIEKGIKEYSFSEICQIIESNDAKILGVFISKMDNNTMQATIKIGHGGMNTIVQTFRRYDYNIISNHEEDSYVEDLKDRSNYLDKYLNI